MTVFLPTLNQMAFLVLLLAAGYMLVRRGIVPMGSDAILSKLENTLFIPALVLSTFMTNFTVERLSVAWQYLMMGFAVILPTMPLAVFIAKKCTKDEYIRKIYTYGLAFSNFGFVGNAVVSAIFPDIFLEYLVFVLPFWMFIYVWGVPYLLMPQTGEKKSVLSNLKALINPMFISMIVGMAIGLIDPPLPPFIASCASSLGGCMSPIAMLLTGMTVAQLDLKATLSKASLYIVSAIRLIVIPIVAIVILSFIPLPYPLELCTVCNLAMPLGLSTVVIPSAYGMDTSEAAGMALVSHLLSCLTIPLVFMLFEMMI